MLLLVEQLEVVANFNRIHYGTFITNEAHNAYLASDDKDMVKYCLIVIRENLVNKYEVMHQVTKTSDD